MMWKGLATRVELLIPHLTPKGKDQAAWIVEYPSKLDNAAGNFSRLYTIAVNDLEAPADGSR